MVSASPLPSDMSATKPAWARAIAHSATEFPLTPLPILSGSLPETLCGTLYRNGPGRLNRGGVPVGHWFDGDGAILAVHITPVGARATYRYVKTEGYLAEESQNRFLYSGYGMTPPGMLWERWGKPVKNAANTSVLALTDRLLALWEGGNPHALDLETLETSGHDDFAGALPNNLAYSAHPKRDPKTGDIYNFGVTPGLNSTLNLFQSDRTGRVKQHTTLPLRGLPLVHDCVLAGPYLVFFVPPVQIPLLPVGLGLQSFCDAMRWQPQMGTDVIVVERESLTEISRSEAQPWFQWHFSNGYEEADGTVVIDVVRYVDFKTNQYLKEVATGQIHTETKGTFWRIRLHPQTGIVLSEEELIDQSCEFPIVKPHEVGADAEAIFLNIQRPNVNTDGELFGAIARFEPATQKLTIANLGDNRYPSEPMFASHPDHPAQGYVLTVVFDGNTDSSELWIFDADGLDQEPVGRLGLPSIIPHSFHGTWKALS
ncbi:MAG: carotenoid oxygenase family protein [Cyanobacteria bacterium P01_E01_bin.6]